MEIPAVGNLGIERYTDSGEVSGEVVFLTLNGTNASLPEDVELRDKIVIFSADAEASRRSFFLIARKRPAASFRIIEGEPVSSPQTLFPGRRRRFGHRRTLERHCRRIRVVGTPTPVGSVSLDPARRRAGRSRR